MQDMFFSDTTTVHFPFDATYNDSAIITNLYTQRDIKENENNVSLFACPRRYHHRPITMNHCRLYRGHTGSDDANLEACHVLDDVSKSSDSIRMTMSPHYYHPYASSSSRRSGSCQSKSQYRQRQHLKRNVSPPSSTDSVAIIHPLFDLNDVQVGRSLLVEDAYSQQDDTIMNENDAPHVADGSDHVHYADFTAVWHSSTQNKKNDHPDHVLGREAAATSPPTWLNNDGTIKTPYDANREQCNPSHYSNYDAESSCIAHSLSTSDVLLGLNGCHPSLLQDSTIAIHHEQQPPLPPNEIGTNQSIPSLLSLGGKKPMPLVTAKRRQYHGNSAACSAMKYILRRMLQQQEHVQQQPFHKAEDYNNRYHVTASSHGGNMLHDKNDTAVHDGQYLLHLADTALPIREQQVFTSKNEQCLNRKRTITNDDTTVLHLPVTVDANHGAISNDHHPVEKTPMHDDDHHMAQRTEVTSNNDNTIITDVDPSTHDATTTTTTLLIRGKKKIDFEPLDEELNSHPYKYIVQLRVPLQSNPVLQLAMRRLSPLTSSQGTSTYFRSWSTTSNNTTSSIQDNHTRGMNMSVADRDRHVHKRNHDDSDHFHKGNISGNQQQQHHIHSHESQQSYNDKSPLRNMKQSNNRNPPSSTLKMPIVHMHLCVQQQQPCHYDDTEEEEPSSQRKGKGCSSSTRGENAVMCLNSKHMNSTLHCQELIKDVAIYYWEICLTTTSYYHQRGNFVFRFVTDDDKMVYESSPFRIFARRKMLAKESRYNSKLPSNVSVKKPRPVLRRSMRQKQQIVRRNYLT